MRPSSWIALALLAALLLLLAGCGGGSAYYYRSYGPSWGYGAYDRLDYGRPIYIGRPDPLPPMPDMPEAVPLPEPPPDIDILD
jgi:hypothetical protein